MAVSSPVLPRTRGDLLTCISLQDQIKNEDKHFCPECNKGISRKFDLKRHRSTHLKDEQLRQAKHYCPITETGCDAASLQPSNVKAHIKAKHIHVYHLMCFDCRPTFQRFPDTVALSEHIKLEHSSKPRRKVVKQRQDIIGPLPPTPCKNSDNFPPPAGRFLHPLSPPPSQRSTVELPDIIAVSPSAFSDAELRPSRSPSPPRTEWYRATRSHLDLYKNLQNACRNRRGRQLPSPVPSSPATDEDSESSRSGFPPPSSPPTSRVVAPARVFNKLPSPHPSGTARRCHLPTRHSPNVHKNLRYISGMDRARHLHSLAPSVSTTGEGSGSSSSRFLPPPSPPPTNQYNIPGSTFNNTLPSLSSSRASSRRFTPPYTTRASKADTDSLWVSPRVRPAGSRLHKSDSEMKK
ncbi:hypothetical protein IW261DRAFT_1642098 [Armillaria novae-zelandiae]|uniref:C2H2-type domain-containing protein n=1 Tax=Armillaria novae-zelandiae TaxID=153914 RepID=A0AA39P2I1_9AGAR|nr:hypothetical protein IW261DRAFT_1642098 [Armillaria novae-zelandiae]